MNYQAHYERLIARARGRILTGYRERHHVVARCMGGGNEPANIVELTAEEHYVAHQLLVKMYPGAKTLAHAATMMAVLCSGNKAYGWLRRHNSDAMKGNKWCAKISAAHLGKKKPRTAEHQMRLWASRRANAAMQKVAA